MAASGSGVALVGAIVGKLWRQAVDTCGARAKRSQIYRSYVLVPGASIVQPLVSRRLGDRRKRPLSLAVQSGAGHFCRARAVDPVTAFQTQGSPWTRDVEEDGVGRRDPA